jgi:8-oxo-dGTP pyrophosphatase MutT (NUDIX family)
LQALDRTDPSALIHALRSALPARKHPVDGGDGLTPAAVLVPLRHHDDGWHVILNVRSNEVGQHKGEIAFPGGRLEPTDDDMVACALREIWEEMGVRPEDVDVLGPLAAQQTKTDFLVWPTVGVIPYPYEFKPEPREVAEVIEIPLDTLLDGTAVRHEARMTPEGDLLRLTSYGYGRHLVFGATAWILGELIEVIDEIGWGT